MSKHCLLHGMAILLFVVGVTKGGSGRSDVKGLQGTWLMVAIEVDGVAKEKELPLDNLVRLTIKDTKYTMTVFGIVGDEGVIEIDDSKKPKAFDMKAAGDDQKVSLGIYELDGDTLKICFNEPGAKERPTEFQSKWNNKCDIRTQSNRLAMMLLKREKRR